MNFRRYNLPDLRKILFFFFLRIRSQKNSTQTGTAKTWMGKGRNRPATRDPRKKS